MIRVGQSQRGDLTTLFDISRYLAQTRGEASAIASFIQRNNFLSDLSRISPSAYRVAGKGVMILRGVAVDQLPTEARAWAETIAMKIVELRPSTSGGAIVHRTWEELVGRALVSEIADAFHVPTESRRRLSESVLANGRVYKTHTPWEYIADILRVFDVMQICWGHDVAIPLVLVANAEHPVAGKAKVIRPTALPDLINANRSTSVEFLAVRPYPIPSETKGALTLDDLEGEIVDAWANHLERPAHSVERAISHMYLLDRYNLYNRDKTDVRGYLWNVDKLTVEIVDSVSLGGAGPSLDSRIKEIPGVDSFSVAEVGLSISKGSAKPAFSKADLSGKHRAALAAFNEVERHLGHLENTSFRSFVRFIPPLRDAIGSDIDNCDVVLIACLRQPFNKLLAAAKLEEERSSSSEISEYSPISPTALVQLEWLSESVVELASALANSKLFDEGREALGIGEHDLTANANEISELVETLESHSNEVAARLREYLKLHRAAGNLSPELPHVIVASMHNIIVTTLNALLEASTSEKPADKDTRAQTNDIPSKSRPAWDSFRETAGENLANLLLGRFGIPGAVAVAALVSWFHASAPALASNTPTAFELLKQALEAIVN